MILTLLAVVNVCPSIVINVEYTSKGKCIVSFYGSSLTITFAAQYITDLCEASRAKLQQFS